MVTFTAGTTQIPSDNISVSAANTIAPPSGVTQSVGLVGTADIGSDDTQGTATEGESYRVTNGSQARNLFGDDSELTRQVDLAFLNGVSVVYAAAFQTTTETTTLSSTDTGTISEQVADPNVSIGHLITEPSEEITIVYDESPSAPDSGIAVNPISGEIQAASSGTYDIEYSSYSHQTAIDAVVSDEPRVMAVLSEDPAVHTYASSELESKQESFAFSHAIGGVRPVGDTESVSDYVTSFDSLPTTSNRLGLTAASRGYTNTAETDEVRTAGVAASMAAAKPLGESITADGLAGIFSLRDTFAVDQLGGLLDNDLLPIGEYGGLNIIQDRMTATDEAFSRLYGNEVIDEAVRRTHTVSTDFIGEQSTVTNINNYRRNLRNQYKDLRDDSPPKLDGFNLQISQDVDGDLSVTLLLDVVDIIDTVDVDAIVGDILSVEVSA